MTYYPKSKIKTNLYANSGELMYEDSKEPYIGFYWANFKGEFYTGKNPNEKPSLKLIKLFDTQNNTPTLGNPSVNLIESYITPYNSEYVGLKNQSIQKDVRYNPSSYYPSLIKDDYKIGEFQRYFLKKINEFYFIEVNKDTYNFIKNKDKRYLFEIYIPISIPWHISGIKSNVSNINKTSIISIPGLAEFLKFEFTKFYLYPLQNDLNTLGNELKDTSGKIYIGDYHIDEKEGFMQTKNKPNSPILYPISIEIENQLLTNILKKQDQYINPTQQGSDIYNKIKSNTSGSIGRANNSRGTALVN